ncbi:hypothetical protein SAMN05216285_3162 [Natrinema salifodinae]|uniref:Uncharacterized protein n=1 Tax=Natrinema salifodinae TaxID=1202768 RepID=A0A1I0Q6Y4_9EURY|nr:hypothetical protein SAMN05216285_3162 [Natrinema salifodinae]
MTKFDPALLEFFEEQGIAMPPAVVPYNTGGISHPKLIRRYLIISNHNIS